MAASTSPLASMAGAFVRVSSVMAILPCEAAVVPAQRHARVYSSESARTKPPTAPCRSQGGRPGVECFLLPALTRGAAIRSTPPLAEPSVKLPALPGCLDNFQWSQADEAILVNAEPDFGDRPASVHSGTNKSGWAPQATGSGAHARATGRGSPPNRSG